MLENQVTINLFISKSIAVIYLVMANLPMKFDYQVKGSLDFNGQQMLYTCKKAK